MAWPKGRPHPSKGKPKPGAAAIVAAAAPVVAPLVMAAPVVTHPPIVTAPPIVAPPARRRPKDVRDMTRPELEAYALAIGLQKRALELSDDRLRQNIMAFLGEMFADA